MPTITAASVESYVQEVRNVFSTGVRGIFYLETVEIRATEGRLVVGTIFYGAVPCQIIFQSQSDPRFSTPCTPKFCYGEWLSANGISLRRYDGFNAGNVPS